MTSRYSREPNQRYRNGSNRFAVGVSRIRISPEEELRRWEDQQKKKPVLQQQVTGQVKWYSFRRNFGFIQRDDDSKDVFVHQLAIIKSRIRKPNLRTLCDGETVQFDVVEGKKGQEASNVTGPDGAEVQGSRIIFLQPPEHHYSGVNTYRSEPYRDRRATRNIPVYYDNNRRQVPRDFRLRDAGDVHYDNNARSHRYPQEYRDRLIARGRVSMGYRDRFYAYQDPRRSHSPNQKQPSKLADAPKKPIEVNKNINNQKSGETQQQRRNGKRHFTNRRSLKNSKGAIPANLNMSTNAENSEDKLKPATSKDLATGNYQDLKSETESAIKGVAEIKVK